jgi:hypothetical protein
MNTPAQLGGAPIDVNDPTLQQLRSPALDLDSLYGRGPADAEHARFYNADGRTLKLGTTAATTFGGPTSNVDRPGFDLPREAGSKSAAIPDARNDENLAVAQTHLAMMRFHNRVAAANPALSFAQVRALVVKHYQWMLRTDFLPRIVEQSIVTDVFNNGRQFFEVNPAAGSFPTMPVEFSVAAFRLGHSMIRETYEWNRVFRTGGVPATLAQLFNFSGTSGTLSPGGPPAERLPTNWIADFRRLFNFGEAGRADLTVPAADFNLTRRIDTLMVDPLATLPPGSFGANAPPVPARLANLAFRNLSRANMVELASGQQMAAMMGVTPLSANVILNGAGGPGAANLSGLTAAQKATITSNTPLWFYILREAEMNGGKLTGVGGRIVAEVFHRAIEGSNDSILKDTAFVPSLGDPGNPPPAGTFRMVDLMLFAFEGNAALLNPLG